MMEDTAYYTKTNPVEKENSIFSKIYDVWHFVAKVVLYAIFVFMIFIGFVLACYVIGVQRNLKAGNYEAPLYSAFVIISPSMEPTINVEDAIIVKKTNVSKIKKGDIITFNSTDERFAGTTITHRVIEVISSTNGKPMLRTKGDNNNVEDATLVENKDLVGKVILRIPKIGYLQYLLSTAYGWIAIVVLPCMGIIIYDFIKIFKRLLFLNRRKRAKESEK